MLADHHPQHGLATIPLEKHSSSSLFSFPGSNFNCHIPGEGVLWGVRNAAGTSSELCGEGAGQSPGPWALERNQTTSLSTLQGKTIGLAVEIQGPRSQSRAVSGLGKSFISHWEHYEETGQESRSLCIGRSLRGSQNCSSNHTREYTLRWWLILWYWPGAASWGSLSCPLGRPLKNSLVVILLVFLFW